MSRESGPLSAVLRCLQKARVGMKRQEMSEHTWLLTRWLCSGGTWRASSPVLCEREAEEPTACCSHPRNFPTACGAPAGAEGAQGPRGAPTAPVPAEPQDRWLCCGRATRQDGELLECPQMRFHLQACAE